MPNQADQFGKTSLLKIARFFSALALVTLVATSHVPPAMPALRVVTVPILEDNYAYLVIDEDSKTV